MKGRKGEKREVGEMCSEKGFHEEGIYFARNIEFHI